MSRETDLATALADMDEMDLAQTARAEVESLWHDLDRAVNRALNGSWSIECGGITRRLVQFMRAGVRVEWDYVPTAVLASGLYEAIHEAAGLEFVPVDHDTVNALIAARY